MKSFNLISQGWTPSRIALMVASIGVVLWWGRVALEDIVLFATGQTDNGYILCAPLAALYLAWLRRSRLQFIRYRPNLVGPALVIVGMLASNWGDRQGVQFAWHGGLMLAVFGCIYSMTGFEVIRQFGPALFAAAMVIPVPGRVRQDLATPAQEFSVETTTQLLQLLGFEAVRAGNVIVIDGQAVAVGEACNGMRMVFALALVVYAFVFSIPFSGWTRLVLITLAPIVGLVCNIIRLVPTSIAYGWFNGTTAEQIHDVAGWLMLPLALLMLVGIVRVMRWLDLPVMKWRVASS